jgi:(p)ppGpp synthase/HD superfamily hydrolase
VKQKESLREAGKIILMDYLWMHGPLIEKSSYIEEDFSVPTTIDELAALLPGNTQYDDIDDLFLRIGKQHDRVLINSFVSKLFKVPQKLLINAEKNKTSLISTKNVLDAVYDRAKDAADAAASAQNSIPIESTPETEATTSDSDWPKPSKVEISDEKADYADPEHLCMECLPVYGDDIIGTRPENHTNDAIPKVHRTCCPVAQRAIHRALAGSKRSVEENGLDKARYQKQVDSVSLRRGATDRVLESPITEVPVKLKWSSYEPDEEYFFNAEIVVHCEDRKLLLADCSEIVSDLSEIVKTGSLTTNEHATLAFLIKIRCLDDLQKVMNSLRKIPSVMAVERRVSTLL